MSRPGPLPRTPRPGARPAARAAGVAALALVALAPACAAATSTNTPSGTVSPPASTAGTTPGGSTPGGSTPGGTTPTGTGPRSTAPTRSTAKITAFELPSSITCHGDVDVSVVATYATTGATSVAVLVDGEQVRGTPPVTGTFTVPLRCDGTAHTVVLSALDPDGHAALQSKVVLTDTQPAGD